VKSDKFVVKLKRHPSSYETDQGEQPRKDFIDLCQNGRPTCPPAEEQPQASGSCIKVLNYRHPIVRFYRKRGLGADQIHYSHSRHWPRLHNTI